MAGLQNLFSERLMRLIPVRRRSEPIGSEQTEHTLPTQLSSIQPVLQVALVPGLAVPQKCGDGIPPLPPGERLLYYDSVLLSGKSVCILVTTAPVDEGHRVRVTCTGSWLIDSGWLRVGHHRYKGQPCQTYLVFEPVDFPASLRDLRVLFTEVDSVVLDSDPLVKGR